VYKRQSRHMAKCFAFHALLAGQRVPAIEAPL